MLVILLGSAPVLASFVYDLRFCFVYALLCPSAILVLHLDVDKKNWFDLLVLVLVLCGQSRLLETRLELLVNNNNKNSSEKEKERELLINDYLHFHILALSFGV